MFNIASLLQAISLCGIGGLLAYFRHADIEQLEQQWRRKTLPQYPQDTTSEDPPGDIEISEEVQDTRIPSYNVYEVYDHRKQYVLTLHKPAITHFISKGTRPNSRHTSQSTQLPERNLPGMLYH